MSWSFEWYPRPEVALRAAPSWESRRRRRLGRTVSRYHALNPDNPWLTACGYVIDGDSTQPLGAGTLECQHRSCQRILRNVRDNDSCSCSL